MPDTSQSAAAATVHAVIARALNELGVDTMFGLMGDSNLFMVDSFVRNEGGRYVAATHEAGAMMMASGHAMLTGGVSVATVTQGPAVSNLITPLIDAVKGMLPVVLLCGDTSTKDPDHPQAVSQRALVEGAGAIYARLRAPALAAIDVADAVKRARLERRPVVLAMPTEMMWEAASLPALPKVPAPSRLCPAQDDPAIEEAVGMIAAARAPVVLGGRGAIPARDALIKLANRIGAPLATSLKAKGLFLGEQYNLGIFGTLSTDAGGEAISNADLVISFGAGLNRFTTAKGGYLDGKRLIQVDDDARQLGRLAKPDAAVHGDPALVAELLCYWLDEAEIPSSQATDTLDPAALSAPWPVPKPKGREGTIDLPLALDRINAALPEDRVFVSDGGRFLNEAWTRIDVSHPRNMLLSTNTGAIGLGLGYAIGGAVARPGQRTVLVTGDGGLMMAGLSELATAVTEKLDLTIVVCNDTAYGAEYVQFEDRQMDPGMSMFNWPSFAAVAQAMGAGAARVTSEAELDAAVAGMSAADGPFVVELMLDPAVVPRLHL